MRTTLPLRRRLRHALLALAGLLASPAVAATPEPAPAPAPLRLLVNIPAFRLDVLEHGTLVASYPVTVGLPSDPTPDARYELERVVWNPWWHPPHHRRPRDQVTPPGPRNPMGKVKLEFAAELYYLHGTFKEHEIGSAASRGCVRLRNADAVALALLVHRHAVAPLPAKKLAELAGSRSWRTQAFPLNRPVPIDLVYELVELREGELRIYPDLYRLASLPLPELAARALEAAGHPRERLDLSALPPAPTRRAVALPLERLLLPGEGGAEDAADAAAVATGAPANGTARR